MLLNQDYHYRCWVVCEGGGGAPNTSDRLLLFQKSMASTTSSPRSSSYANIIYCKPVSK